MNVAHEYIVLYKKYGPQGWWPTTPFWRGLKTQKSKRKSQNWKEESGFCPRYYPGKYGRRLSEREKFEIAVGAILTQNTAWKNVEKAIGCLYAQNLMSPQAILSAPIAKLRQCVKSSGYFNQKAKKLRVFCGWLVEKYDGKLGKFLKLPRPLTPTVIRRGYATLSQQGERELIESLRRELLSLWGIGPETADSILLYAGGFPVFVIDAYTRRLCATHDTHFRTYDEYQQFFEERFVPSRQPLTPPLPWACASSARLRPPKGRGKLAELYQEYHALIVQWGKKIK